MSSANRYALTCIDLLTSYIIAVPILDKTAESVVEVYLSGILSRTRASMVCLLDNGSELKYSQLNTILKQLGIKHIYSNPYIPQGNSRIENVHNFLKECIQIFFLVWMPNGISFAVHLYSFNLTPTSDDLESAFFRSMAETPWKDMPDYSVQVIPGIWAMKKV